jgi:hypothetical protein
MQNISFTHPTQIPTIANYSEHEYGKEKTADGVVINNCSIGTNALLNYFANHAFTTNKRHRDLYAINLMTIVRNCFEPTLSDSEILDRVNNDLELLKSYIISYNESFIEPSDILFYVPNYNGLSVHKRKISGHKARIEQLTESLGKMLPNRPTNIYNTNKTRIFVNTFNASFPQFNIYKFIMTNSRKGSSSDVLLISHCALDWHLYQLVFHTEVLESYMGEVINYKQFGEKIFKNKFIPFNKYTHLVFGDTLLVNPILKRKEKQLALEIAEKRKWHIRTEAEIKVDLVNKCNIDKVVLDILKFY